MSKNSAIGKMIARGVAINKIVTPNMQKAIKRRVDLITELNLVASNVGKVYGAERVQLAKQALRKIYAQSHALHESPIGNNKDSWRVEGAKSPAVGRDKAKRSPSQPKVEFSRKK